ncbi:MAG: methylthioribulose 1-phosphate dehydratase [Gammaproteobacteria bacterium]|jgi:methylthioribulose-1-phosphate dehydratase
MKDEAKALVEVCHFFGARDWCPATGGNFSVRLSDDRCLITQSGKEKSRLRENDLMVCTFDGKAVDKHLLPSAETTLHTCLYKMDNRIGAVLHTHSVNATVLSRMAEDRLIISGYEMQKALGGNLTHDEEIEILIFENDQDIEALAARIEQQRPAQPGFLVRGHGLYAWGEDLNQARRHIEGFEFLLACLWQEKLLERK